LVCDVRRLGREAVPFALLALSEEAKQLACDHYTGVKFTESNGFVYRWTKRHNITNSHLHGPGGATDMVDWERRMAVLRTRMLRMDPDFVQKMDEAALFYQLAPTKSYLLECDARETRGTALPSAKARITIIFCMKATSSIKNNAVIGKAAQPVCFRGAPPLPVKYYHKNIAWMNKAVYARWFAGLCTAWRAFTGRKGFFVMDDVSGHDTSMTSDLMATDWLPPNTTARFQPADQAVKSATKTTYKRGMTRDMLSTFY